MTAGTADLAGLWEAWRERLVARLDADVTPQDERRVHLVLLDDVAAAVAGHRHDEVRRLTATLTVADGPARVLDGSGRGTSPDRAAAANAVATCWDELDEGYRPATAHGGLYTVPAVLAEAEQRGATLAQAGHAVLVGYEVVTGFARCFRPDGPLRLHPHATLAPVGAAAALTWLRTRDPSAVLAAADAALSMSMAGPFRHATTGAEVRNVWPGAGAVVGSLAADAVASGLLADAATALDVLVGTYGLVPSAELDEGPDPDRWAVRDGYHKRYAACQYTHAALEATAEVVDRLGGPPDPAGVARVDVATHPLALGLDDARPTTALGGKFSVPHVVACVLASGATTSDVLDARSLHSPEVARLRDLVRLDTWEPLPAPPHDRPASVTVTMLDGKVATAQCLSAVGGPDRPLDDVEVLAKAEMLVGDAAPGFGATARMLLAGDVSGETPVAVLLDDLVGPATARVAR